MTKKFLLFLWAATAASSAGAVGFNLGVNQSFGPDDYEGTNVYAAAAWGGVSLSPELRRYSAEGSGGAVNTVLTRLGYDNRLFGVGATGGTTLKKDGYSTVFGGADLALTLSPGGEDGIRRIGGPGRGGAPVGKGVARVDLGGGFLSTQYRQDGAAGAADNELTQHEVHGFAGASILGLMLSVRGSRFLYNEDVRNRASLPSTAWTPVAGLTPYVNGFAKESVHVRGEFAILPMIRPNIHYTYASFQELAGGFRPPDKRAIGFGLSVGLELVAVEAGFQRIINSGPAKDANFASVGASIRL